MDNVHITQVDGEPPIYREMKPVPVTLESCILNSEEDFPDIQADQGLISQDNCNDRELSAEEINSMIMINEGPNTLRSAQEEFDSDKVSASIRKSSDIKKILTSDLPKSGRFLSTKSLQKLSGAKKVIKKNSKYINEDEMDVDDSSDTKVKKVLTKQSKAIKENLNKTNQDKFDCKITKKNVKSETLKMKLLKKSTPLERLALKKKSLKALKKVRANKNKDLDSTVKILKKKVLENNVVVEKKEAIPKNEEPESTKKSSQTAEGEKKKHKYVNKPKLLISRSGRVRKIKDVSDFVLSKNKEGKILSPEGDQVAEAGRRNDAESKMEIPERSTTNEVDSKFESVQENKYQGDLLQSALSESVESWFDISSEVEKKGKKARAKVKIVPKDSDDCFEETEIPQKEKNSNNLLENEEQIILEAVKEEEKEKEEKEIAKSSFVEEEKIGEIGTQIMKESLKDVIESEKPKSGIMKEPKSKNEENKEENDKKLADINGKKVKPTPRQLMGYKKKRRKGRNISVTSYLKNYGERINFDVKLDLEDIEPKKQKSPTEEAEGVKKETPEDGNDSNLEKNKEVESKSINFDESTENNKTSPLKRSQSADSLQSSLELKVESPRKSAEMPASLPSREKNLDLGVHDCSSLVKKGNLDELINTSNKTQRNEAKEKKSGINKNMGSVKKEVRDSEGPKQENTEEVSEAKTESKFIEKDKRFKIPKRIQKKRRRNPFFTKVFGMKNKRKKMWTLARKEKFSCRKRNSPQKKQAGETKSPEDSNSVKSEGSKTVEKIENDKVVESLSEKLEMSESFRANSALSIPLKKRPRRKANETFDDVKKESNEAAHNSEKQDCERRKSHREIKLTAKIVDMIATSTSHKRSRKSSSSKEESTIVKEEAESSTQKSAGGSVAKTRPKEALPEQPLAAVPSVVELRFLVTPKFQTSLLGKVPIDSSFCATKILIKKAPRKNGNFKRPKNTMRNNLDRHVTIPPLLECNW